MKAPRGPTWVRWVTAPEAPPAKVETKFAGTLHFHGGYPTDETIQRLYDELDFQRGFAPDGRMRKILDEAATVGSFMALSICNSPRDEFKRYPDRQWFDNIAGYPEFRDDYQRPMVDEMIRMAWFGTGRAQAMHGLKPGVGSAYTWAYRDAKGEWIDSSRTYRLRLPGPIPAKDFCRSSSTTCAHDRCSPTGARIRA
jgi:hypothetical protein